MVRVYLIRHPPVGVDPGVCYGRSDVPLAEGWEDSFAATMSRVESADLAGAELHASPLTRCRRPAETLGRPVHLDPRLAELDFGHWELRPWSDIPVGEIDRWRRDIAEARVPGGETLHELHERATAYWLALAGRGLERVLVVTHGGVIRCLLARVLALEPQRTLALSIDYGGVTRISIDRRFTRVDYVNR